jgi:hypothetical protein
MISILDLCEAVAARTEEPEVAVQQYLKKFFPEQARKSKYEHIGWEVPGVLESIHTTGDTIYLVFEEDASERTEQGGIWRYMSKERKALVLKSIRFFESLGYHARRGKTFNGKLHVSNWVTLDPIYTVPVTRKVRSEEKYLYHVSPSFNDESIKASGFVPSNKNLTSSFHGNRVYFVLGSVNDVEGSAKGFAVDRLSRALKNTARDYAKQQGRKKKDFDTYTIFRIDVTKVPKTVKFYEDPENNEYVYTTDPVPANCISGAEQIDLKGKKGYSIY